MCFRAGGEICYVSLAPFSLRSLKEVRYDFFLNKAVKFWYQRSAFMHVFKELVKMTESVKWNSCRLHGGSSLDMHCSVHSFQISKIFTQRTDGRLRQGRLRSVALQVLSKLGGEKYLGSKYSGL
jgi:hypothetical protein